MSAACRASRGHVGGQCRLGLTLKNWHRQRHAAATALGPIGNVDLEMSRGVNEKETAAWGSCRRTRSPCTDVHRVYAPRNLIG